MLRRLTVLTLLALASVNAYAVGWVNTQVTIVGYWANTSGQVFLTTSGNQNPDSCGTPQYLLINDTTYKFVVAALVAAQSTGQEVTLYYNGCSGGGTSGYPVISAIAVPNY
jgi:hypothetical protein